MRYQWTDRDYQDTDGHVIISRQNGQNQTRIDDQQDEAVINLSDTYLILIARGDEMDGANEEHHYQQDEQQHLLQIPCRIIKKQLKLSQL